MTPRVLHLFNVFGAPTESAHLDLARGLADRGYHVAAACESMAAEAPDGALPLIRHDRINVTPADDIDAQMQAVARRRVVDIDADLVHGHFGTRVLPAAAFLTAGVPTVLSLYGYDASRLLRDPAWIARYRWAAEHGALFAVLSEHMRVRLAGFGVPDRAIRVMHLGVDLQDWPYAPAAPPDPSLLFVGRLTPKKGLTILIDALRHTADVHLQLVGDGPLHTELQQQVDRLGLSARVRFCGALPRRRLPELFAKTSALVLPSLTAPDGDEEGTPVVLMEAQAAGLPVITTAHAGNPEVVTPAGQSFVVTPGSVAELADAIDRLCALTSGERQQLQHAGRAWIEQHFSLEGVLTRWTQLYTQMLATA